MTRPTKTVLNQIQLPLEEDVSDVSFDILLVVYKSKLSYRNDFLFVLLIYPINQSIWLIRTMSCQVAILVGWALYCLNTQVCHISFKQSNIEISETSSPSSIQNWYSPMWAVYRNQSHAYLWEKGNRHEILMSILDQWITLYRNQNTQIGLRMKK